MFIKGTTLREVQSTRVFLCELYKLKLDTYVHFYELDDAWREWGERILAYKPAT